MSVPHNDRREARDGVSTDGTAARGAAGGAQRRGAGDRGVCRAADADRGAAHSRHRGSSKGQGTGEPEGDHKEAQGGYRRGGSQVGKLTRSGARRVAPTLANMTGVTS